MNREEITVPLSDFDLLFGRFMEQLAGAPAPEVFLAACLASSHLASGHICVDLKDYAGASIFFPHAQTGLAAPPWDRWAECLRCSKVVGEPFDYRPLILDDSLLYLYRYWRYERRLADLIIQRAGQVDNKYDPERFKAEIESLIPPSDGDQTNWLKVAAFTAATKKLALISGGPGTGKTYLTARIMALLTKLEAPRLLNIALVAPTGKAATRLMESIQDARWHLPHIPLPTETFTLHRLLKMRPHHPSSPYTPENPLPYEVIMMDEASMVDLPLFSRLLYALRDDARVILLGDKDQLASVEPGAVFGELCNTSAAAGYSFDFVGECKKITGEELPPSPPRGALSDSLVVLRKNFRFPAQSAIHQLSEAVRNGDEGSFMETLRSKGGEVTWVRWESWKNLSAMMEEIIVRGYAPYLKAKEVEEAFSLFHKFRVLCAIREGPLGMENVNRLIESILAKKGLLSPGRPWYQKMPVMITKNDYGLRLMNGDCGLILREKNYLAAFFPDEEGKMKSYHPAHLPPYETVYAMTVHKSQGSEFDEVLVVLPDRLSPVLTRELLYTAVTRARERLAIIASEEILLATLNRKTERTSGLARLLSKA